jgi:thioredoxin-like negative regulator of GroEL
MMFNRVVIQPHFGFLTCQLRMFSGRHVKNDTTHGQKPDETFIYIKEMSVQQDFDEAVQNMEKPTVIQAGASWCNPCQVLKPLLVDAVKKENGAVHFLYIDIDKHRGIAEMLEVSTHAA